MLICVMGWCKWCYDNVWYDDAYVLWYYRNDYYDNVWYDDVDVLWCYGMSAFHVYIWWMLMYDSCNT